MEYAVGDEVVFTNELSGIKGVIVDIDNEWWKPYEVEYMENNVKKHSMLVCEDEIRLLEEPVKEVENTIIRAMNDIARIYEEIKELNDDRDDSRLFHAMSDMCHTIAWLMEVKNDDGIRRG